MRRFGSALFGLSLSAAVAACGSRTLGAGQDGGPRDCTPACTAPEVCNRATGQCECPGADCSPGGACASPPADSFEIHVSTSTGGELGCESLSGVEDSLQYEITGELSVADGLLTIVAPDGAEAAFVHNLPWSPFSPGTCFEDLPAVTSRIELRLAEGIHCVRKLVVRTPDRLILLAQEGDLSLSPDLPVDVRVADIGCPAGPEGPCGAPEVFALEVQLGLLEPVVVEQGRNTLVRWEGVLFRVHNLRSYATGACDDRWNYGFLVAQECYDGTALW